MKRLTLDIGLYWMLAPSTPPMALACPGVTKERFCPSSPVSIVGLPSRSSPIAPMLIVDLTVPPNETGLTLRSSRSLMDRRPALRSCSEPLSL
jgi:hypothetical protein